MAYVIIEHYGDKKSKSLAKKLSSKKKILKRIIMAIKWRQGIGESPKLNWC